jgi:hypothetical protein
MTKFWKEVGFSVLVAAAVLALAWLVIRWSRSPYQRFVGDCSETYNVSDCHMRWEREHRMPDDYGKAR